MRKVGKIGFIGGGNMAEAILKGLLAAGYEQNGLTVSEPLPERRRQLEERYGIAVSPENLETVQKSDLIVLSVKPQMAEKVLSTLAPALTTEKLVVSIMAGVTAQAIEAITPAGTRVVRVMPNTPALVQDGATAVAPGSAASADDVAIVQQLFSTVGECWVVDEKVMDGVTGLSGSGPAYVLTFIEALSDAGVKNGLPRDAAFGLALRTVMGTARLLVESGEHPALLREKVTSPGGTTIAGLHALEKGGFRAAVMDAVDAATARSKELGK